MTATPQLLRSVQKTDDHNGTAQRAEHVRDVIASAQIEGLEITAYTKSLFDKYAEGKIEIDEVLEGVSNTYGPRV
jgi:reverse gyrase